MLLSGRIDRVDAVERDGVVYLRVIDYKSGRVTINLSDIYNSLKLQLLTYLDVAMTHAQNQLGREVVPGAILYFCIDDPIIKTKGKVPAEDEIEKKLLQEMRMTGMVLADQAVIKMMDRQFGPDSDLLPVKIKKDGNFTAHSAVLTREQFELLRSHLKTQLISAGNDIIDGVVDIAPVRQGSTRSCRYCPFKPVCQFDILIEGNTYRNITTAERDTIWRKLAQEFEEGGNV